MTTFGTLGGPPAARPPAAGAALTLPAPETRKCPLPLAAPLRVIGFEGTAHTFAVGIIEIPATGDPRDLRLLANVQDMQRPESGGIHPREAANHHAEVAGAVLRKAMADAGLAPRDLDLVAFSQAPGLGPCLRTTATAARAFALGHGLPLLGVNHCVAHLEIGRALTPAQDPILLYASGGNTQVIAYTRGRYRVIGETVDIGVGNLLDKFARHLGLPFPGGPQVEHLALAGKTLVDLPYSIKGMDVAFSGLLTTAVARLDVHSREDLAFSLQETAFGMLCEVTERALAHTGKDEVVLGGGVACNERLREMAARMAEDRGARSFAPPKPVCVDNGVMIALLGAIAHRAGLRQTLAETAVDQRQRTDDIPISWRSEPAPRPAGAAFLHVGAEATITPAAFLGREAVRKERPRKSYRHPDLDLLVRTRRTRAEARALGDARRAGVRTPMVLDVDGAALVLERLADAPLRRADPEDLAPFRAFGRAVARLHGVNLIHGDLTTSNALIQDGEVILLDFGLSQVSEEAEAKGTDLHVLSEALGATHPRPEEAFAAFLAGYREEGGAAAVPVEAALAEVVRRGRYRGT